MRTILPCLRHGNWQRQGQLGGCTAGAWKVFVFSLASASVCFPGMGWEKQHGVTRLFLWFSLPHVSMADTDFSCLNFSYKLGVGLFVFIWRLKAWVQLFLPIQLHLLVIFAHFLEWCECGGVLEEHLKGADFSAGGFLLGKLVEVLDLEAGQGCGVLGFACQQGLLPLAPC